MTRPITLLLACTFLLPNTAGAQAPPCKPCGGISVADPVAAALALGGAPRLEEQVPLYVAWSVELAQAATTAAATSEIVDAGAVPWLRLLFRTPEPILDHADRFAAELAGATAIAQSAAPRTHFQIIWLPESDSPSENGSSPSSPSAEQYAYLFKRASVALTGVNSKARVITAPLPSDISFLETFYGEETAAYLDGLAFGPTSTDRLAPVLRRASELDPGRPIVLDGAPWPQDPWLVLSDAARWTEAGASLVLFSVNPSMLLEEEDLLPLKILAREFQGDLSLDPHSRPSGALEAWSFVRGEDLSLRIIARGTPGADNLALVFPDNQLKRPRRINATNGEAEDLFGQKRTEEGLAVSLSSPSEVVLLTLDRMSAEEIEGLEGLEERVTVADERQIPVEEILRRLQGFDDAQARRLQHYRALNTTHMRFQFGTGVQGLEATFEGDFFFRQGQGFDWAWQTFFVNGVRWRGKKLPEIPLVQPEKAAALPLEIHFSKEYSYRLRGTEVVDGRDCWVVDFNPNTDPLPGKTLHRGSVWVDREHFGRVRTRALQVGLEGEVLSNEETFYFSPVTAAGAPGPWTPESFWLPTRVVGQQLLSVLNATTVVEKETLLSAIDINSDGFEQQRQAVLESETTMVRDTDKGMRYLVKDKESGKRVVQEEFRKNRTFALAGVFWDESLDFPLPLAGIDFFSFDFKGTGKQVNIFFAGALLIGNIADPDVFGSKWDAGANLFAFAISGGNTVFRDGQESFAEEIKSRPASFSLFLGRPLGSYGKLDLTYSLRRTDFSTDSETDDAFALPVDHFTHEGRLELKYNRSGYRLVAEGSHHMRSDWEAWGLPGTPERDSFNEDTKEYDKWGAAIAKTWWLPRFQKVGIELEYKDGRNLDRFSKYEFGIFSDIRVHGYQQDRVRADQAWGGHLSYGFEVGELLRLQLVGDGIFATDEEAGLEDEFLGGIGLEGTFLGPWQTIVRVDLGAAVAGPDDGFAAMLTFLKLFR